MANRATITIHENRVGVNGTVTLTTTKTAATLVAAVATAIAAASDGQVLSGSLSLDSGFVADTATPATTAQVGSKLLITGDAANGNTYKCEIPCWPTTAIGAGSDVIAVPAGLKSAIDAIWETADGTAIVCRANGLYVNR
jgi:hypothetical protein